MRPSPAPPAGGLARGPAGPIIAVMTAERPAARLFLDQNMDDAQVLSFAGGVAAVYSARHPEHDGANEDGAGVISVDDERGVLVVADGLGGQPGGASASQIALRCLKKSVERPANPDAPIRSAILDAVEQANQSVMDLGIGAATTLAALEITGPTLRPYHVGDSAILVVGQRGKVKLQTVAHSPVGYAIEAGLLDEREAMHHDDRHLISNMVGTPDMRIEVGSRVELAPRDTALLATDGLFDNLSLREVVEIVRSRAIGLVSAELAQRCGQRMRRAAEDRPSKPDDLTFVLFRPNGHHGPASGNGGPVQA